MMNLLAISILLLLAVFDANGHEFEFNLCSVNLPSEFKQLKNADTVARFSRLKGMSASIVELDYVPDNIDEFFKSDDKKLVSHFEHLDARFWVYDVVIEDINFTIRSIIIAQNHLRLSLHSIEPKELKGILGNCFSDEVINKLTSLGK